LKPFFIAISLLCFGSSIFGQSSGSIDIPFQFYFHNEKIAAGEYYHLSTSIKDSIRIDVVKCILSNVAVTDLDGNIHFAENTFFFIDLHDSIHSKITLPIPNIDQVRSIQFSIGTDSLTNIDGARGGALDPVHGMYWAWQSGYINVKIEGSSSVCKTRKNAFQFHLGGYLSPNQTIQQLAFANTSNNINIAILIDSILQHHTLINTPEVMSPSAHAVKYMQQFKQSFQLVR
jgi:hypothetical protein